MGSILREAHGVDSGGSGLRPAVRPKHLPLTGTLGQCGSVVGEEASRRFRDALTSVGLTLCGAALALECSETRVQAKTDPRRTDAPVTYADLLRLARAGGKGREVARLLHADLGAELESEGALPMADALPMLALQWSVQAGHVAQALAAFCAGPSEPARLAGLRAIGSATKVLGTLRAMLADQRG